MPGRSLNTQTGPEGFSEEVTFELDLEGISIGPRVWRCSQGSWGWGGAGLGLGMGEAHPCQQGGSHGSFLRDRDAVEPGTKASSSSSEDEDSGEAAGSQ